MSRPIPQLSEDEALESGDSAGSEDITEDKERGAVLAEFAIALTPLLATFFGLMQVMHMYQAKLIVNHGAVTGARAAIVMAAENNNIPESKSKDQGKNEIKAAVALAMEAWIDDGALEKVKVDIRDDSADDPNGAVTVRVTAQYNCGVPLGSTLLCGLKRHLVQTASVTLPHQGAEYQIEEEGSP
jgi:Flp pilus assembly protein TadG